MRDPDVWWISVAGRDLLARGRVPTENVTSFAEPHHPWVMHEWIFGPLYAAGLAYLGPRFFALVAVAFGAAVVTIVVASAAVARRPIVPAALGLVTLGAFGKRFALARPPGMALVFPAAVASLAFGPRFGPWHAVAAVALELVWANAHGSFPLGVALLAAGALASDPAARRWKAIAAGGAALATLANPYGLRLHALVLAYALGDERSGGAVSFVRTNIAEFGPLWRDPWVVAGAPERAGLAVMGLVAAGAALSRAFRVRGLVALGLLAMAIAQVRHVELFGVVSAIVLAPFVADRVERAGADVAAGDVRVRAALAIVPALAPALILHVAVSARRTPADWVDASLGGADLAALAADLPAGARAYAPLMDSGYLAWLGAPRGVRIFVDSRNDPYDREALRDAFALDGPELTRDEALHLLDRWHVEQVLVPRDRALYALLGAAPASTLWTLAAEHGDWRRFARAAPALTSGPRPSAREAWR